MRPDLNLPRETDIDDKGIYLRISVDSSSFLPWIAILMDGDQVVQVGKGHFLEQALRDCEERLRAQSIPSDSFGTERRSERRSLVAHTIKELRRRS